jgi:hypothetical protein
MQLGDEALVHRIDGAEKQCCGKRKRHPRADGKRNRHAKPAAAVDHAGREWAGGTQRQTGSANRHQAGAKHDGQGAHPEGRAALCGQSFRVVTTGAHGKPERRARHQVGEQERGNDCEIGELRLREQHIADMG